MANHDRTGQTVEISERRRNQRSLVKARVRFREPGSAAFDASILDLSCTGFRIEAFGRPPIGSRIILIIPGLEALNAIVRHHADDKLGCEFLLPLHPAVAAHLQARLAL